MTSEGKSASLIELALKKLTKAEARTKAIERKGRELGNCSECGDDMLTCAMSLCWAAQDHRDCFTEEELEFYHKETGA
jgi:hypothetical protein